jgi:hypothetical protein
VRALSWFAICCAISNLPPFRKYSVMPVARKVWHPILGFGEQWNRNYT